MPRLLVVSHAAVNRPHRKAFDLIGREPGWDVHIAAPLAVRFGQGEKRCDDPPERAAYTLHRLPTALQNVGRFQWFIGLGGLVSRLRPDVVFVEWDPGTWPVIHAWLVTRPFRCPVVAYTVENIRRDRVRDLVDGLRRRDPRAVARDATVVLLDRIGPRVTRHLASVNIEGVGIFRDRGWNGPIEVVPLGTDLELFRPMDSSTLRRELGLEGTFVVGYFGRLIPEKAIHLVVDALPRLGPDVRFLLDMFKNFEPGSYAAELLERAERLGVRERVVTFDAPHEEVPRYMCCCDVVVLPTTTTDRVKEQYGRVLAEAMACGVPVIGSTCGNIPEIVGDAGWIVPEGDGDALAEAIELVRSDRGERERRVELGKRRVRELLSVEAQRDALLRLFEKAMAS